MSPVCSATYLPGLYCKTKRTGVRSTRTRRLKARIPEIGAVRLRFEQALHALRVELEIDEAITVVEFEVEHLQHGEAEEAGDFCAGLVADFGEVEGDGIYVGLLEVAEAEGDFGVVDLLDVAA